MEFTVRVPVFFSARPPRTKGTKDIAVHETRVFDIREVSLREMLPVLETSEAYNAAQYDMLEAKLKSQRRTVRSLDGNLYRKVASVADTERLRLFDSPFPRSFRRYGGFRSAISYTDMREPLEQQVNSESLTAPLYHQQAWQMGCAELRNNRFENFWPVDFPAVANNERGSNGEWWKRNHYSLEDVLPRIRDYDHQALEVSRSLADRHMEGLVVAGDDIWERCGSPAYKVEYTTGVNALVTVTMVHVPRWQETRLDIQYFPIGERDAAFQYAEEVLQAITSNVEHRYQSYRVLDRTVPAIIHDPESLALDRGAEELFRVSCALAAENRRFLVRNPEKQARFGTDAVEGVFNAYEELTKTNYLLGEYGNPEEWVENNADIWVSCGRHQGYYTFGQKHLNSLLLSRAKQNYENRPISFTPRSEAGFGV